MVCQNDSSATKPFAEDSCAPTSQHGPGAEGGAAAVLHLQRLQSSRNGFGFGRQAGEVPSPSDYSGRTSPADRSIHGGVGSMWVVRAAWKFYCCGLHDLLPLLRLRVRQYFSEDVVLKQIPAAVMSGCEHTQHQRPVLYIN